jgi:hypothetical protein
MTDDTPTLKDIWRLLGTMSKRFDSLERQIVALDTRLSAQIADVETGLTALATRTQAGLGALKESIEARDFRRGEHGRRITDLETLVRG